MYQCLLEQIIYYNSNNSLVEEYLKKIFVYIMDDIDDNYHRQLVYNNNVVILKSMRKGADIFVIWGNHSYKKDLTNWINILESGAVDKYISESLKFYIGDDINKECTNCRTFCDLMKITDNLYLCKQCVADIQFGGKLPIQCDIRCFDIESALPNVMDFWYTINKSSLILFSARKNNIVCYRFIITLSEHLLHGSLTGCNLQPDDGCCKICSCSYYMENINGTVMCKQCYDILTYRDEIIKSVIISKLLSFWNLDDINTDIKADISKLLIDMSLFSYHDRHIS